METLKHENAYEQPSRTDTLPYGANDMWQDVPIGTIDDTDISTFYGAYNTLLQYYIANYPRAKLGIVASFWCTAAYINAVKAIGEKYHVPVLNLYDDPNVPLTPNNKNGAVPSEIKTIRNNQYNVSSTNTHPNALWHELESYFIEQWLMTL